MKARGWILLAWFFLSLAPYTAHSNGVATVVGPFRTQEDCNSMRGWAGQRAAVSPWCWFN